MCRTALCGMFAWMLLASTLAFAQDITVTTNASGITIGGSPGSWSTGFGLVNGLGVGTPGTGQTVLSTAGGKLYTSPYNIVITGAAGGVKAVVSAYVSTNFVHSSILQVYSCVATCANAANYSAVSTNSGVRSIPVTEAPATAAIRAVPPIPQPTSSSRTPGSTPSRSRTCLLAGAPPACSWSTGNRSVGPR